MPFSADISRLLIMIYAARRFAAIAYAAADAAASGNIAERMASLPRWLSPCAAA